eukprot:1937200-Lingulodinium_polyedra.AAC.1
MRAVPRRPQPGVAPSVPACQDHCRWHLGRGHAGVGGRGPGPPAAPGARARARLASAGQGRWARAH